MHRNRDAGRLQFTTDIATAVGHGLFQMIAVGTPPDEDGSADLSYVLAVAKSIGQHMDEYRVIVDKSTVPVGTADKVKAEVQAQLHARKVDAEFDVVSNPEFLKEGAAIDDFMKPDRIIIGTDNPRTTELLRTLYEPFNRNHDRVISMDIRSAELTKYAANAMLATKISFMNELANIAECVDADIEQVRVGIGSDPRIGYQFIYPGGGYGGSCFPKDTRALVASASLDLHIQAVVGQVQLSSHEPLGKRRIPVEHTIPSAKPVQASGLLRPISLRIGLRAVAQGLIASSALQVLANQGLDFVESRDDGRIAFEGNG